MFFFFLFMIIVFGITLGGISQFGFKLLKKYKMCLLNIDVYL